MGYWPTTISSRGRAGLGSTGAKQVMAARGQLAAALNDPELSVPADSPLRRAGEAEAARPASDVSREDVLTDAGVRAIKAADLLKALTQANTAIHDFTASANEIIGALAVPAQIQQAASARDNALLSAHGLSEEDVPQFVTTLSGIVQSMRDNFQPQHLELGAAGRLVAAATSVSAVRVTAAEVASSAKGAVEPVAVYIPSVLLALIIMAGAVAAVFSTQYLANPNFGTTADYWALGLIRSPKAWYG